MLVAPVMLAHVEPPLVLTCHCTVGVGLPIAMAVKVAETPALTDAVVGLVVMIGAPATVCVTALLVLPVKLLSPAYTAVMLWLPAVRAAVLNVAVVPLIVPVPSVVLPSLNVTVPVAPLVTVAVNVTEPP